MKHILFAMFDSEEAAAAALRDVKDEGIPEEYVSLIVHKDRLDEDDLELRESDARTGYVDGVLVGGAAGALVGMLLAGPFGLLGIGPLAAAVFGGGAGSVYGLLGGALSGASITDRELLRISKALKEGKILVTAELDGLDVVELVREIFERHGAIEATKAVA